MTGSAPLPDIVRPGVRAALVGRWDVGPDRQHGAAAALAAEGSGAPDLLSFSTLVSTDGETVLSYAQSAREQNAEPFLRTCRSALSRRIGDTTAQRRRPDPVEYRRYRSHFSDLTRRPTCVVIVTVEADGLAVARAWSDTVVTALQAEPHAGGLAAHLHISLDGSRIVNYAEWVDEQAHRDALDDAHPASEEWRRVQEMPGVRPLGFQRYRAF